MCADIPQICFTKPLKPNLGHIKACWCCCSLKELLYKCLPLSALDLRFNLAFMIMVTMSSIGKSGILSQIFCMQGSTIYVENTLVNLNFQQTCYSKNLT